MLGPPSVFLKCTKTDTKTDRPRKILAKGLQASCFDVRWCGSVLDLILLFSFGLQACTAADARHSVELIVDLTCLSTWLDGAFVRLS